MGIAEWTLLTAPNAHAQAQGQGYDEHGQAYQPPPQSQDVLHAAAIDAMSKLTRILYALTPFLRSRNCNCAFGD